MTAVQGSDSRTGGAPVPLIVVEASERAVGRLRSALERDGRRVVDGWSGERDAVRAGVVADADDAAEALLAAVWGSGVLVHARAERVVVDRLVDDLRRLGVVEHVVDEPDEPLLTREERALLDELRQGRTLGMAAQSLHLSRRTADRRLAEARAKLGVQTTAEAVVAFDRT